MSQSATKQAAPELPLYSLSSALARGLTVGVTATLVQLVLLALLLEFCGIVTIL